MFFTKFIKQYYKSALFLVVHVFCLRVLASRTLETVNRINANQINENEIISIKANDSPYIMTPKINIQVGAIYCKKPIIYNGIFCAPFVNNSEGIAVAAPVNSNKKSVWNVS